MKRIVGATLIGIVVLGLSACGDDPDGSANRVFTPEELEAALLTAGDLDASKLGDDWTVAMGGTFESREEGPPIFDDSAWCPDALSQSDGLDELVTIASPNGAAVEISQARDRRRQFHGISQQLWSNDQAERFVDVVENAFEFCEGKSWDPGGEEADEVSIERLDLNSAGDGDAEAMIIAVTPGPDGFYRWNSRTIAVRVGTIVMVLRDLDVQIEGSDSFYTDEEWQQLIDVALVKVQALL